MLCPKCGKIYNNYVTYCISCGETLVSGETENIEDQENFTEEKPDFVRQINMSNYKSKSGEESSEELVPIPVKQEETDAKSSHNKGKKLLNSAASAILSFCLAVFTLLLSGTVCGRELTNEKNISSAVKNVDLLSVPASEIGLDELDGYYIPSDATVEEAVSVMVYGSGVTSDNIRRIYESSTLKSFLDTSVSEYAEYIRSGTLPDKITSERIKEIFTENISVISQNTGYALSESDIAIAYNEIDSFSDKLSQLSVSSIENKAGGYIRLIRAYISLPALISEIAAAAAVIVLIWVINKKRTAALRYIGMPLVTIGIIVLAINFMFSMQIGIFSGFSGLYGEIAKGTAAAVSDGMYRFGGASIFAGAALMIFSKLCSPKTFNLS